MQERSALLKKAGRLLLVGSAWLASIALAGVVGYEVGGRAGFNSGFLAASVSSHGSCAASAVRSIKEISSGDIANAIALLDGEVNSALLSYWGSEGLDLERFNATGFPASCKRLYFKIIGPYRAATPPKGLSPDVTETITAVARRLASGGEAETNCESRPPHNKRMQTDEPWRSPSQPPPP